MNTIKLNCAILVGLLFAGCTRIGTRQIDKNTTTIYNIDENGKTNQITSEIRETGTKASGVAAFKGSATLKGVEIEQDGGKQGLKVKESDQRTDMDKFFDLLERAETLAAAKYGISMPLKSSTQEDNPTRTRVFSRPMAAPAGYKWVLKPINDPSTPKPEMQS